MYTPATIGLEFDTAIKKLTDTKTVVEITGIYSSRHGKCFGQFYYDKLLDTKDETISVTILITL